jgi:hypothetical protein
MPRGANLYTSVLNNPLRYRDPDGRNPIGTVITWIGEEAAPVVGEVVAAVAAGATAVAAAVAASPVVLGGAIGITGGIILSHTDIKADPNSGAGCGSYCAPPPVDETPSDGVPKPNFELPKGTPKDGVPVEDFDEQPTGKWAKTPADPISPPTGPDRKKGDSTPYVKSRTDAPTKKKDKDEGKVSKKKTEKKEDNKSKKTVQPESGDCGMECLIHRSPW